MNSKRQGAGLGPWLHSGLAWAMSLSFCWVFARYLLLAILACCIRPKPKSNTTIHNISPSLFLSEIPPETKKNGSPHSKLCAFSAIFVWAIFFSWSASGTSSKGAATALSNFCRVNDAKNDTGIARYAWNYSCHHRDWRTRLPSLSAATVPGSMLWVG